MSETIGIKENRELRAVIHDITSGCFLTKDEYMKIMLVVKGAVDRICKEQGVFEDAT